MKNKKNIILNSLIVVFSLVFLFSLYQVISYFSTSYSENKAFQDIIGDVENAKTPQVTVKPTQNETSSPNPTPEPTPEINENQLIFEAYDKLHQENSDFAAWVKIPFSKINYPVMFTPNDPEYYLRRNFDKNYATSGVIFAGEGVELFPKSDNIVLHGHNMNDGTMFHDLINYNNPDYLKEHPVIEFDTLYTRATYEIFTVFSIDVSENNNHYPFYNFINSDGGHEFQTFVDYCNNNSKYFIDVVPEYGDKFLTLSTCDYSSVNGRLVVVARLIDEKSKEELLKD